MVRSLERCTEFYDIYFPFLALALDVGDWRLGMGMDCLIYYCFVLSYGVEDGCSMD